MKTVVALVETQPETIQQDYKRVMSLANLPRAARQPSEPKAHAILVDAPNRHFTPGFGATPWQLDCVLNQLGEDAAVAQVAIINEGGISSIADLNMGAAMNPQYGAVGAQADAAFVALV